MKSIKNKNLTKSLIFSKVCFSISKSFIDFSQLNFLIAYRSSFLSLINPFLFRTFLKTSFLILEYFIKSNYTLVFITAFVDSSLFNKFYQICKNKNILLIKDTNVRLGFLTNQKGSNILLITLFLNPAKIEIIQKEAAITSTPLITYSNLEGNRDLSSIYASGNYSSFIVQNLILTLLTICLEKNYESA